MKNLVSRLLVVTFTLVYFAACNSGSADTEETRARALANKQPQTNNTINAAPGEATPVLPGDQIRIQQPSIKPTNVNQEPAQPAIDPKKLTTIKFDEPEFNFGVLKSGDKVKHLFKFKNTGDKPLVITNAQASCGCTVADWPHEPIAPGATGTIRTQFDSKDKTGSITKSVTITSNTNPTQTQIFLKGEVIGDPAQPSNKTYTK